MIFFLLVNFHLLFQIDTPPGTIKVGDFYIDKTEILNIHWLEYQYYLKQELDESEYWKISPDSSNNWYEIPSRRYEPITLISYEQAKAFCEWRSDVVSKKLGKEITYRLPTSEEWDLIAEKVIKEDNKGISKAIDKLKKTVADKKGAYYLLSRKSPKNILYDLFSNVSEMTATKGIAKGGNNYELLEIENLDKSIIYNGPNPYLGFRCIAEIGTTNIR